MAAWQHVEPLDDADRDALDAQEEIKRKQAAAAKRIQEFAEAVVKREHQRIAALAAALEGAAGGTCRDCFGAIARAVERPVWRMRPAGGHAWPSAQMALDQIRE